MTENPQEMQNKAKQIKRFLTEKSSCDHMNLADSLRFCEEFIEWCEKEKRIYFRQRLEARKAELLAKNKNYGEALEILKKLSAEAKKVEDKLLLIQVSISESQVHSLLGNLPVAKSTLVVARTTSASVYCPQDLQAKLDAQSGNVALGEKDYKSAYSYFYESFEGFAAQKDRERALQSLKYMILSKMLSGRPEEIKLLLQTNKIKEFRGEEIEMVIQIAETYQKHSLKHFKAILLRHKDRLSQDRIIALNLDNVLKGLLEKSVLRILKPYSRVELCHVAEELEMSESETERIISRLILDKKLCGVIDQFNGHVVMFEEKGENKLHERIVELINVLEASVAKLERRAAQRALV